MIINDFLFCFYQHTFMPTKKIIKQKKNYFRSLKKKHKYDQIQGERSMNEIYVIIL